MYSRLVYFKPKLDILPIRHEEEFWKFLKICFRSPRQTLRNNLRTAHYAYDKLPVTLLGLRGQQLTIDDFLKIWKIIDVGAFYL